MRVCWGQCVSAFYPGSSCIQGPPFSKFFFSVFLFFFFIFFLKPFRGPTVSSMFVVGSIFSSQNRSFVRRLWYHSTPHPPSPPPQYPTPSPSPAYLSWCGTAGMAGGDAGWTGIAAVVADGPAWPSWRVAVQAGSCWHCWAHMTGLAWQVRRDWTCMAGQARMGWRSWADTVGLTWCGIAKRLTKDRFKYGNI